MLFSYTYCEVMILNNWFKWNGVSCIQYGIYVTELPPPTIPAERVTHTNVPGRAGSLTTLEGDYVYDDIVLSCTCVISDPSKIPAIAGWLRGSGTVTFADRDGGFYYATVANQIPFEKILRGNPHRLFTINFRCKPFWYVEYCDPEIFLTQMETTAIINNPGNVPSEPVINITGTGEITLMVNGTIIELSDMNGDIIIDSQLQEAYNGTVSMNSNMSGDFPMLQPGQNAISWSGDLTALVIEPNWRYLL